MFTTLQGCRALAAISVAAFHMSILLGSPAFGGTGVRPFAPLTRDGALGVDFFFVLSGFIILQAHWRDVGVPSGVRRYVLRRAIRIFPIYWIYLVACIVGMFIVGSPHLRLATAADWVTVFGLVRITPVELPLAQAWTLFHEMAFYSAFVLLIANRIIGAVVFALWSLVVVLAFHYPSSATQDFQSVVTAASNLNFGIGMLAFLSVGKLGKGSGRAVLLAGVTLLAGLLVYRSSLVHGQALTTLGCAIAFGMIISGAVALEKAGALSVPGWLCLIGNASYSIYLLHEHVENYGMRALLAIGVDQSRHQLAIFLGLMALVVAVGCLAYLLIERPLLTLLRRWLDTDKVARHTELAPVRRSP